MIENGNQHKSQICCLIIELLRHHNGTHFKKNFKLENFQKNPIPEA